jgi:hypothetical protein
MPAKRRPPNWQSNSDVQMEGSVMPNHWSVIFAVVSAGVMRVTDNQKES